MVRKERTRGERGPAAGFDAKQVAKDAAKRRREREVRARQRISAEAMRIDHGSVSPERFAVSMRAECEKQTRRHGHRPPDPEGEHGCADRMVRELLRKLGFTKVANLHEKHARWCA